MTTTVLRRELGNLRMAAGNEKKYDRVVDGINLMEWVGIGWVRIRTATPRDRKVYPTVVDKEPA